MGCSRPRVASPASSSCLKQTSIPQEPPPTCDTVVQVVDLGDAEQQDSEESCEKQLETSVPAPCLDFEAADDADLLEACRQFDYAQPESAAARFVAFLNFDPKFVFQGTPFHH